MQAPPKHILVVDDDTFQLELVKGHLADLGMSEVLCVTEGHKAISLLKDPQATKFDLIITDICMPPPDGIDLIKFLAEQDISIPLILMSGSPEEMFKSVIQFAKTTRVQLAGTLAKPFTPEELASLLGANFSRPAVLSTSLTDVIQKDVAPAVSTKKSALVVDDDPILFATAAAMLRDKGFMDISHASDVASARQYLTSNASVGLIMLDLNLPGIDGVEFMEDLRGRWSKVPLVIVSSAHESVRNAALHLAKAYGLDVKGAVSKPLTPQKLDDTLT